MLGNHSSIVIPQNTPYAQEMRRHEAFHTSFGPPGRPYEYREFPKRVYRALKGGASPEFEGFTVNNETEQRNMQSRGYSLTQADALTALEREHTEHGKLAAERNYEIAHGRLSEKAAAEVRAAEEAHGATHMPEVKETPIRKRGRPATSTVPA